VVAETPRCSHLFESSPAQPCTTVITYLTNQPQPEHTESAVTGQRVNRRTSGGKPDVHSGTLGSSRAKSWFRRLFLRAYLRSSYARMVEEIRSLPLRIRATRRQNAILPGRGFVLPPPQEPMPYFGLLQSCSEDMQRLQAQKRWMTSLDTDMAVEAWTAGLQYALRTQSTIGKSSSA
jgi:hypothetical protein